MGFEEATRLTAMQEGRKRGKEGSKAPRYRHIDRPGKELKQPAKAPQKGNFKKGDFSKGQFSGLSALVPLCLSAPKALHFWTLFEDAAATRTIRV